MDSINYRSGVLAASEKLEYGIDAPGVIRNLLVAGVACTLAAKVIPAFTLAGQHFDLTDNFLWAGIPCFLSGVFMYLYARFGKYRHRERMLKMVSWRGDEKVLDVGTGRGLLMIGAAKKLSTGKAFGIDIWQTQDLSNNAITLTQRNAILEGVKDKILLRSEDARKMTFDDDSFDVVFSNLCIHNMPKPEDRRKAIREIVRVLKPGGQAIISDFQKTSEYVNTFKEAGLEVTRSAPYFFGYLSTTTSSYR